MSNKINKAFNLPSTSNEVNTNAFSSNDNYFIAPEKCKPKQIPFKMECINKFDLLCSIYTGETFSDYGIKTGDSGNVVLEKIIQNLNKDEEDIPTVTKTSQLVNDGENGTDKYITLNDIPPIPIFPSKLSEFENDENFITIEDIPDVYVPTQVSELENDAGYITSNDLPPPVDVPTKTSDLTNDGEDGSYPYLTVQDINWVVSKVGINEIDDNYAWSVESASGRSFKMTDYNSIMINHNGNRIEIDENDMLYMTAHDNIKAYTPYFEVEGEFNVILGSSSSKFFRFNEAITTTVTTPRTIYTDGVNVKYVGNDGISKDLAFDKQVIKTVSSATLLDDSFHGAVVWITADVIIDVPNSLRSDFYCVFYVVGIFVATLNPVSGASIGSPYGLYIYSNGSAFLCRFDSNSFNSK